jgi:hypothetical protein
MHSEQRFKVSLTRNIETKNGWLFQDILCPSVTSLGLYNRSRSRFCSIHLYVPSISYPFQISFFLDPNNWIIGTIPFTPHLLIILSSTSNPPTSPHLADQKYQTQIMQLASNFKTVYLRFQSAIRFRRRRPAKTHEIVSGPWAWQTIQRRISVAHKPDKSKKSE